MLFYHHVFCKALFLDKCYKNRFVLFIAPLLIFMCHAQASLKKTHWSHVGYLGISTPNMVMLVIMLYTNKTSIYDNYIIFLLFLSLSLLYL